MHLRAERLRKCARLMIFILFDVKDLHCSCMHCLGNKSQQNTVNG